jgi:hypothetical protein
VAWTRSGPPDQPPRTGPRRLSGRAGRAALAVAERHALEARELSEGLARTRAFNAALLATAYVETDLEAALSAGSEALAMSAALQSGRAVRYVGDLRRRLRRRYGSHSEVTDFDEQPVSYSGAAE